MTGEPTNDALVKVAADLRAIREYTAALEIELEYARAREMPGGDALAYVAPVANLEAWEHQYETLERLERPRDHVQDEFDDQVPPLQLILFWSEAWRIEHGNETDIRPTIDSETRFLGECLEWAWDHEPHFENFAKDVRAAKTQIENTLHEGIRTERAKTTCIDCEGIRLVKQYAATEDEDFWLCPRCRRKYDRPAFRRAQHQHLASQGAERWVRISEGVAAIPRPENTVRTWIRRLQVRAICDVTTHAVYVWWPELREQHLEAVDRELQRKRSA